MKVRVLDFSLLLSRHSGINDTKEVVDTHFCPPSWECTGVREVTGTVGPREGFSNGNFKLMDTTLWPLAMLQKLSFFLIQVANEGEKS